MSAKPSAETQLRTIRREVAIERKSRNAEMQRVRDIIAEKERYRGQLTQAQQEIAEWKRRFDLLLARTPEEGR